MAKTTVKKDGDKEIVEIELGDGAADGRTKVLRLTVAGTNAVFKALKNYRRGRRERVGRHTMEGKVCGNCGAPIDDRATVCPSCRPVGKKRR